MVDTTNMTTDELIRRQSDAVLNGTAMAIASTVTTITNPVGVKGADGSAIVSAGNPLLTRPSTTFATPTTTPLAGNASFTSPTIDFGASPSSYASLVIQASADQSGTVKVMVSDDDVTYYACQSTAITANVGTSFAFSIANRYAQLVFTNGSSNQGAFRLAYGKR